MQNYSIFGNTEPPDTLNIYIYTCIECMLRSLLKHFLTETKPTINSFMTGIFFYVSV